MGELFRWAQLLSFRGLFDSFDRQTSSRTIPEPHIPNEESSDVLIFCLLPNNTFSRCFLFFLN